jgi:hypothetical protein
LTDPVSFFLFIDQIEAFNNLYTSVAYLTLMPFKEAEKVQTWLVIDQELTRILDLPDISSLRNLLTNEPVVTLNPI